jgi:RecA-family ATPase
MRSPTTAKGEEIDSDVREIQFLKNNYGRQGDSIQIRWEGGVFVPESAPASFERIARDRDDDHRFLDLLAKYEGQGRKHRGQWCNRRAARRRCGFSSKACWSCQ